MKKLFTLITFLAFAFSGFAQPANDDCAGLIDLGEVPICPVLDTFTNVGATGSVIASDPADNVPTCFNGLGDRDVWFSFTVPFSSAIDFEIHVNGVDGPNGSIQQPQIAVYRGDCLLDELQELACVSSASSETSTMLELVGLTPGITYFIRVNDWSASANTNEGDFELCIKEPDPIFIMGEDATSDACEGILWDSGGEDMDYLVNEDYTFTICPSQPTGCINLEIENYNVEQSYDFLYFHAGEDTSAPLMGELTGSGSDISLQAGSDCVTIRFFSDVIIPAEGFNISWSCGTDSCETTFVPCAETETVFNLPFNGSGTTCNAGNDVQSGPCANSTELLEGEDFIYTYTPTSEQCIEILTTGANLNTGLSIYSSCPESGAAECLAYAENTTSDSLYVSNMSLSAFQTIFIVLSNGDACTDFNIEINNVDCPVTAAARPLCEDAILLNNCTGLPEAFAVGQQSFLNADYFQPGINDGCQPGAGAAHYTWLFFQAQTDGEFGFIAQNGSEFEASNVNIQVWGPITDFDAMCDFMAENQPIRSTGALNNAENMTGLANVNPMTGDAVTDDCEDETGDGFISTLPVENGLIYLVLINDFEGNIVNGGVQLDFSPTTSGVLDGLPADTPLSADEFTLNGNAFYEPQNFDYSCIQLTGAQNSQKSCVWAAEQADFSQAFTQNIIVYLGDNDGGADGICMVYHQDPNGPDACGISGGEIGAGSIQNSFIVEFDTWQNGGLGDPFQDHLAVNVNGDMGAPIGGPAVLGNIEDGIEHIVTFTWDPATNFYEIFFDGVSQISGNYDIIQNCFQGSSTAYCGFTASTGGANNLQYACTGDQVYPTVITDSTFIQICEGDSINVFGNMVGESGVYSEAYPQENGCDSTHVITLAVVPSIQTFESIEICQGDTVIIFGNPVSMVGDYSETYTTPSGCDSTHTITVSIFTEETSETINLCNGETVIVFGNPVDTAGVFSETFPASNGCDSMHTITVALLASDSTFETIDLCQGDTIDVFGNAVGMAGVFSETFTTQSGCDSIHTITVTVSPAPETFEDIQICDNESVVIFGEIVTDAGVYTETFTTAEGCDSIHTVTLTVAPTVETFESFTICDNESIVIFGDTVTMAGDYVETFATTEGCDSVHTIKLIVNPTVETAETIQICDNESVVIFGDTVTTAGIYAETFATTDGCDSAHTITLEILSTFATSESISICFGQTIEIFGTPTNTSGIYEMTFTATNGCDSTHTVSLTVFDEIILDLQSTDATCSGGGDGFAIAEATGGSGGFTYEWSNGETTSTITGLTAGVYAVTVTDQYGCVTNATTTVGEPPVIVTTATGVDVTCDELGSATATASGGTGTLSFLWSNDETTATINDLAAGTYSYTVTDENGCTMTSDVTITGALGPDGASVTIDQMPTEDEPESGALTAEVTGGTAPFTYEWSNGETTASIDSLGTGEYTVTITDENGCTITASAGIFIPACTGGKIWNDLNRDGCQDGGELGHEGILMALSGTDIWGNSIVDTTTTAINGEYVFENLPPGDYQVTMAEIPAEYLVSPSNECNDDSKDSDFSSDGIGLDVISLVEGHCCLIVDGGLYDACGNVHNPGTICCDQVLCGPGNIPDPIYSSIPAQGSNSIEYMWIYTHTLNNGTWYMVKDVFGQPVTTEELAPGPLAQTTYFARCVRSTGCNKWLETNIVTIEVEDVAVAAIDPPGAICVGQEVNFTAADNPAGATYHWDFGHLATPSTSTSRTPSVTWNQWGYVVITLTVTYDDCVSKHELLVVVSDDPTYCGSNSKPGGKGTGAMDFASAVEKSGFAIYPNPASDVLNVKWSDQAQSTIQCEVLSAEGKVLMSNELDAQAGHHSIGLDDLNAGIYFIRLTQKGGEPQMFKWVKM